MEEAVTKALNHLRGLGYQPTRDSLAALWKPFLARRSPRIDLVLQHEDASLEHVDWKTGSRAWVDEIQNATGRIVVGRAFQEARIRSTTHFLGSTATRSRALEQEEVVAVWREIKELVAAIETEQTWTPTPNPLCAHCPFQRNGCALYS